MTAIVAYTRHPEADRHVPCGICAEPIRRVTIREIEQACPKCGQQQTIERTKQMAKIHKAFMAYVESLEVGYSSCAVALEFADARHSSHRREVWPRVFERIHSGDHLLIDALSNWHDVGDAVASIAEMLRAGVTVHLVDRDLVLEPESGAHELLGILAELDCAPKDRDALLRKALVRSSGKSLNQYSAGYGWCWATDARGNKHRVPNHEQRQVMALLIDWRDRGWEWRECHAELKARGVRSPHGRPYCLKSLLRLYRAGVRLFAQEEARLP